MTDEEEYQEYERIMRARRERIVAFMRRERADCLAEINCLLKTYNCEVLGCPLEDYPARLLPTLPPGYEDLLKAALYTVWIFICICMSLRVFRFAKNMKILD